MTALARFDPYAELARIRAGATPAAVPSVETTPQTGREGSTLAGLATLATLPPETRSPAPTSTWREMDTESDAGSTLWTAKDWHEHFEERAAVAMIDGEQPEAEARRIAYECCIVRWLDLHPVKSDGAVCVACGKPDRPGDCLNPFGVGPHAWLHSRCWPAWHAGRRAEATAALANAGITLITEQTV